MSKESSTLDDLKPGFCKDLVLAVLNMSAFSSSCPPEVQRAMLGFCDIGDDEDTSQDKGEEPIEKSIQGLDVFFRC